MKLVAILYLGAMVVVVLALLVRYFHARAGQVDAGSFRGGRRLLTEHSAAPIADFSRIASIVDATTLRQRRVALYGAGSLGSWLAYFLSHLIGELRVVDSDVVESSNVVGGRTIYTHNHLGMRKSNALKQVLETGFPHLRVLAFCEDINGLSDSVLQDIMDGDLVICAVDDIRCILRINELFYGHRPLLYGGFMRRAAEGFACVATRETPCFRCCMQLDAERFETLHREPGLGLDISTIAQVMAKLAIAILDQGETEFSQPIRSALREGKNLIHISNRLSLFGEPFSILWLTPDRRRCEICNRHERR